LAHQAEISGKTYEVLTTFYAKQTQFKPNQTQFAGCPNERKFNINKGL
jgi:hypothetical protein